MTRSVQIHAFASVKGGVGKSTLAWLCASRLARDAEVLLVDLDLASTSLADAQLGLRAPELPALTGGATGTRAIHEKPLGLLSAAETTEARRRRVRARVSELPDNGVLAVPFVNDLLAFYDPEGAAAGPRADALAWRQEPGSRLGVLPTSPNLHEVADAGGWVADRSPAEWQQRLTESFVQLLETAPRVSHLVLDLPPGLFGLAHHALTVMAQLEQNGRVVSDGQPVFDADAAEWDVGCRLYLVCSTTPQDMLLVCPAFDRLKRGDTGIPDSVLVVNRCHTAPSEVWTPEVTSELRDRGQDPRLLRDKAHHVRESDTYRLLFHGARVEEWRLIDVLLGIETSSGGGP